MQFLILAAVMMVFFCPILGPLYGFFLNPLLGVAMSVLSVATVVMLFKKPKVGCLMYLALLFMTVMLGLAAFISS